jgi:SPP1 family predicted phage head-tail adaptor
MAGQLGPKTSIGKLRHRVRVERLIETLNEFRGLEKVWTPVGTDRAEVVPVGGREVFQNGTTQAQATHKVRMRYRSDLAPKMRLVWLDTGAVLNIVSCPPSVGSANLIELLCVAEK